MNQLLHWLDDRTGYRELLHEALYERIPGGARWRYVWGSTLVFTFAVQVITGLFLWTAYSPSAQTAWESVYFIQEVMYLGSIVRGIHHFSATAMVVLMALHLIQVICDGAYKAPREINFWLGLILLQIVLGLSLTGYLLPWDQKGYYATKVSTNIMGATPLVGPALQTLVQGGPEYGHHTLTRFFAMHAGLLPGLLIVFLALHIYVFRRHGITATDQHHAPETTFWPDQVLKDAVACLGVLAVVLLLAVFKGAELSGPANPAEAYSAARPEWYFLFLFRFLRFEWVEHYGLAFGAIYVPGVLMTLLFLMPLIAWIKGGHNFNRAFLVLLMIAVAGLTVSAWYDDSHDPDHQSAIAEAGRDAERVRELAERPSKIPVEGATALLRDDPFTQGPRIFAKNCASCHRYDGHNGRGQMVMEQINEVKNGEEVASFPTATDLGNFATRDWWKSVILDYGQHFAPLKQAAWYTKIKAAEAKEEEVDEYIDPDAGEMAEASHEFREKLTKEENKESLAALLEYLVSQSGRDDLKIDEKLAEKGKTIAAEGTLKVGQLDNSCQGCHVTFGVEDKLDPQADNFGYPELTEYGSAKWLKLFITDPGSDLFYVDKNRMPAYKDKMTPRELDLLVRWMVKDYFSTNVEDYKSRKEELQNALKARQRG